MKKAGKVFLLAAVTVILFSGCKLSFNNFMVKLDDIVDRWEATETTGESTARIMLAPIILELQSIRKEANDLQHPACCQYLMDKLLESMDDYIRGFQEFQGGNNYTPYVIFGDEEMDLFKHEYSSFKTNPMKACSEH